MRYRSSICRWAIAVFAVAAFGALLCIAASKSRQATREALDRRFHKLQRSFMSVSDHSEEQQGTETSERTITLGTIAKFLPYVREDLDRSLVERAERELQSLELMFERVKSSKTPGARATIVHPIRPDAQGMGRIYRVVGGGIFVSSPSNADGVPGGGARLDVDSKSGLGRPVFLTGYGTFQRIRDDVEQLPAVGANLIQIEIGPNEIFPKPGFVDRGPVEVLLRVLDRASKVGVAVDVLLSPHYFPAWLLESEPKLRQRREGFVQFCTHHPTAREFLRRYVHTVVSAIKDHPALLSVCLANEVRNDEEPCELATHQWHLWLQRQHGSLEKFNKTHHSHVRSFDAVALPSPFVSHNAQPIWNDYLRFNQEQLADWVGTLASAVHEVAPDLPVHVKVAGPLFFGRLFGPTVGVDPTLLAKVSQLNGNDDINLFQFGRTDFAQSWQSPAMACDLQKSLNPAPTFNSENHIIEDRETRAVPSSHVHTAIWQAAVHGQAAMAAWLWDRSFDPKHDFWGSILERPDAVRALGLINLDLNRVASEIKELQDAHPDVSIFSSTSALAWDDRVPAVTEALYTALSFTGLKIGFVTERQLEEGTTPHTPLLFVPGNIHISQRAFTGLGAYRGRVVFVGGPNLLSRDDHDEPLPTARAAEVLTSGSIPNSWRSVWQRLLPALKNWNIAPAVQLADSESEPVWGVEWRSTHESSGTWIVNLCNYRHDSVTVRLIRDGQSTSGIDVLAGRRLPASIELKSLQTLLVRL